jgi:dihydroxy-acid dehydratase
MSQTIIARARRAEKTPTKPQSLHRKHSSLVVDGYERAASRAMLHAVGFAREDFKKSQVGIASTWSMVTPCNMHIDQLARQAEAGTNAAGGKAIIFGTITVSDGFRWERRG